jgi:glycosyltransferase involved in cell wall biosynthesis
VNRLDSTPFVSVVTPFYNTREFLAECIESVLRQTYQNWEYILVDNWSTDGSSEIAKEYASRFPGKIRLIRTQSFLPQVPNYNFALTCISRDSKYCKMVQADDWIYPECLERMVAVAESDPCIGIVSSHYLRGVPGGGHVEGHGLPYAKGVIPGREICKRQLLGSMYVFGSPTVLLYRSEIVRSTSPFFDESVLHDDTDTSYRILQKWKFGFVHQILSFLRVHDDSIRGSALDFNPNILDRLLQLSKFGPVYLEQDEFARLLQKVKSEYYGFLARRLLAGARRAFWQYHISGLKSGGLRLEKWLLFKHVCLELARLLTNPGSAIARLYNRFQARSRMASSSSKATAIPAVSLEEAAAVPQRPSDTGSNSNA